MAYDEETLEYVFAKTGGHCRYCKKQLSFSNYGQAERRGAWVVDHANPVSRGGTDYLRNLWPACVDCNQEKSDRTAQSYSRSLEPRSASASGCFVATAAFGTPWANEIDSLRRFRDRILLRTQVGRSLVSAYYRAGPEVARWVVRSMHLAAALRPPLRALSRVAAKLLGSSETSSPTANVTYLSARDRRRRDSS